MATEKIQPAEKRRGRNNFIFLSIVALLAVIAGATFRRPEIAMWVGFAMAGYSAIANDSIQSLGTFLNSNSKKPWWLLWMFIGGILVLTFTYAWYQNAGDIAFGRLNRIPQPETFSYLQLLGPIVLLVLTYYKMPVSTTFLLLSLFSSDKTIEGMLAKTFIGYIVAFVVAYILWGLVIKYKGQNKPFKEKNEKKWTIAQWATTGFLWVSWLMQDTANVAVFLPRELTLNHLIAINISLFLLIGLLFYRKGGKIQTIIREKRDIVDVRSATLIDLVFALTLIVFKQWNDLPMSTTWVFLGLIAGRELILSKTNDTLECDNNRKTYKRSLVLVMKDLSRAGIGLLISLGLAWIAGIQL